MYSELGTTITYFQEWFFSFFWNFVFLNKWTMLFFSAPIIFAIIMLMIELILKLSDISLPKSRLPKWLKKSKAEPPKNKDRYTITERFELDPVTMSVTERKPVFTHTITSEGNDFSKYYKSRLDEYNERLDREEN